MSLTLYIIALFRAFFYQFITEFSFKSALFSPGAVNLLFPSNFFSTHSFFLPFVINSLYIIMKGKTYVCKEKILL